MSSETPQPPPPPPPPPPPYKSYSGSNKDNKLIPPPPPTAPCTPPRNSSPTTCNNLLPSKVNLLELAAASLASAIIASKPIQTLASVATRHKEDGSPVTHADGAAQQIICTLLRKISPQVRIVGEETSQDVEVGSYTMHKNAWVGISPRTKRKGIEREAEEEESLFGDILKEVKGRRKSCRDEWKQRMMIANDKKNKAGKSVASSSPSSAALDNLSSFLPSCFLKEEVVDVHRVSVFVDPLDGTSSYTKGDYESVTTLVGIILDNIPIFGVIGQPFGKTNNNINNKTKNDSNQIINTATMNCRGYNCTAVYGGTLTGGSFYVGGEELRRSISFKQTSFETMCRNDESNMKQTSSSVENTANINRHKDEDKQQQQQQRNITKENHESYPFRKAIISKSRSGGVVQKCIDALADQDLLHREPIHITGAGYKTMRLLLGDEEESLWFFPKPGTSLWDMAAADALLRVMGGTVSDKYGKVLDYSKEWTDADNLDGIVACSDLKLHAKCIQLFNEKGWDNEE